LRTGQILVGLILLVIGLLGEAALLGSFVLTGWYYYPTAYLGFGGTVALFALVAIVGLIMIVNGARRPSFRLTAASPYELGEFSRVVLRELSLGASPGQIATATGVSRKEVDRKLDELKAADYVTPNNHLTERGFNALRWEGRRSVPPARPPPP
jgi:hypothetical protein